MEWKYFFLHDPSEDDLQSLAKQYHLEIGHLTDALDPFEVPRYETEKHTAYLFTRLPKEHQQTYTTIPVLFVFSQQVFIIISRESISFVENGTSAIKTLEQKGDSVGLFIWCISKIVDLYYQAVTKINKKVITISSNVDTIQNSDIIQLVAYENILNEFLNALIQTNLILKSFLGDKEFVSNEEEHDRVEDLFLSTGQLVAFLKSSLTATKNMRDAYSVILTNNLNRIIKFFTTLTIIMTIPTIISSFFGMNVLLPFMGHPMAFVYIIGITVGIVGFFFVLFQKNHWL